MATDFHTYGVVSVRSSTNRARCGGFIDVDRREATFMVMSVE
jgi:hypothetical protein